MKRRSKTTAPAAALIAAACLSACGLTGCGPKIPTQPPLNRERMEEIRSAITQGTGGGAVAAARPEPKGWATLTGTVRLPTDTAGQFTDRPTLEVGGDDAAYCTQKGALKSEELLVNPANGGVKNVVVFVDLGKFDDPAKWINPSAAGSTEPVVFDQKYCTFLTHVVAMQLTQPLEIHNSDERGHNLKVGNFNSSIPPGAVRDHSFRKAPRAPLPASCTVHPWMKAFIMPLDNGYFAVTDENGKFTIENVPAGVDVKVKLWQEKAKFISQATVNGAEEKTKNGIPVNLPPPDAEGGPQKTLDLEVVVDPATFSS